MLGGCPDLDLFLTIGDGRLDTLPLDSAFGEVLPKDMGRCGMAVDHLWALACIRVVHEASDPELRQAFQSRRERRRRR